MARDVTQQEAAMADDPSTQVEEPATGTETEPAELGDAGKKALDAERAARREAERKLKEIEDRDKTELQKLQDSIAERDAQLAEIPQVARKEAIRFASLATQQGFLDPEDALAFIDVDLADADAVKTALADLAERKPHLVRVPDAKRLPERPKPAPGTSSTSTEEPSHKERAAAALRELRNK